MAYTLPAGWASDYDSIAERWFFLHRPSGFTQSQFPKQGDELKSVQPAEMAQPQPKPPVAIDVLSERMDAMAISLEQQQGTIVQSSKPQLNQIAPQYQTFQTQTPFTEQHVQGPIHQSWHVQPQSNMSTYPASTPLNYQRQYVNSAQSPGPPLQTQYMAYQAQSSAPVQSASVDNPVQNRPVSATPEYLPYSVKPQANQVIKRKPTNATQHQRKSIPNESNANSSTTQTPVQQIQQQNWQSQPTTTPASNILQAQVSDQQFSGQQIQDQPSALGLRKESGQHQQGSISAQNTNTHGHQNQPFSAATYNYQQSNPSVQQLGCVANQYQTYNVQKPVQDTPSRPTPSLQQNIPSHVLNQQTQVPTHPEPTQSPAQSLSATMSIPSTGTQEVPNIVGIQSQNQAGSEDRRFSTASSSSRPMNTYSPISTPSPHQQSFYSPPPPAVKALQPQNQAQGLSSVPQANTSQNVHTQIASLQNTRIHESRPTSGQFMAQQQNIQHPASPLNLQAQFMPPPLQSNHSNQPSTQNIQGSRNSASPQNLQPQFLPPPPPIANSQPQSPHSSTASASPVQSQTGYNLYRPQSGPASSTFAQLVQQDYIHANSSPPNVSQHNHHHTAQPPPQPHQNYNPSAMGAMTSPTSPDPNRIQPYQTQFAGPPSDPNTLPRIGSVRPGTIKAWSTTALTTSKKGLEKSKAWIKKNPMGSMAMVGGLGVVAEACGVPVLNEAAAAGRVYNGVQANKARQDRILAQQQAGRGRGMGRGVGRGGADQMGEAAIQAAIQQGIQEGMRRAMLAQQGGIHQQTATGRGMPVHQQQQQMNAQFQQALLNAGQLQQGFQGGMQAQYMTPGAHVQALEQHYQAQIAQQILMQQQAVHQQTQQHEPSMLHQIGQVASHITHQQVQQQPQTVHQQSQQHEPSMLHQIGQIASHMPNNQAQQQPQTVWQQVPPAQQQSPSTLSEIASTIQQNQTPQQQPQTVYQQPQPAASPQQQDPSMINQLGQITSMIPSQQQQQSQPIYQQSPTVQQQGPSKLSEIASLMQQNQTQQQAQGQYQQTAPPPTLQSQAPQPQDPSMLNQIGQLANMIPNQQQIHTQYQQSPSLPQQQDPSMLSQLSQIANMLPNQQQTQAQYQQPAPPPTTIQTQQPDPSMLTQLNQLANMMPNQQQTTAQTQQQDPSTLTQLNQFANMMPNQQQSQQGQAQYLPNSPPPASVTQDPFVSHQTSQLQDPSAQIQTQTLDPSLFTTQASGNTTEYTQTPDTTTEYNSVLGGYEIKGAYDPGTSYTDMSTTLALVQAQQNAAMQAAIQSQLQASGGGYDAGGYGSNDMNTTLAMVQAQQNAAVEAAIQEQSQVYNQSSTYDVWTGEESYAVGNLAAAQAQYDMQMQGEANALSLIGDEQYSVASGSNFTDYTTTDPTYARLAMEEQGQENALSLIDDTQYEVTYEDCGDGGVLDLI